MTLPNTISLVEAAVRLRVSPERLRSLAEAGLAPHVVIDGQEPRFQPGKITAWAKDNLWSFCKGMDLERPVFTVNRMKPADRGAVPFEISAINGLAVMDVPRPISGVYFLCRDSKVVYVGQSCSVYNRIPNHTDKKFDSAYFIAVHPDLRMDIERAFIILLDPEYNSERFLYTEEQAFNDLIQHQVIREDWTPAPRQDQSLT